MYHGFTESPEKIERRRRRILAGYHRPGRKPRTGKAGESKPTPKTQAK